MGMEFYDLLAIKNGVINVGKYFPDGSKVAFKYVISDDDRCHVYAILIDDTAPQIFEAINEYSIVGFSGKKGELELPMWLKNTLGGYYNGFLVEPKLFGGVVGELHFLPDDFIFETPRPKKSLKGDKVVFGNNLSTTMLKSAFGENFDCSEGTPKPVR
ncbi:hypothetical protein IJ114_02695 [Candidatus Saccharibacteria bacterium]|nr:hypothetical protein [Candidatus Saccharibacteria bacterium]